MKSVTGYCGFGYLLCWVPHAADSGAGCWVATSLQRLRKQGKCKRLKKYTLKDSGSSHNVKVSYTLPWVIVATA